MIRQRQVYQSVIVEYIDTPVISVSIDGILRKINSFSSAYY